MKRNRIELVGRLEDRPELSCTPGGLAVLRFRVECGERDERLCLEVVVVGERALELERRLAPGGGVRVRGSLRAVSDRRSGPRGVGVEVMAKQIEPAAEV